LEQLTMMLSQIALEKGSNIQLSVEALKRIVGDDDLAPHLQYAHARYAMLLAVLGDHSKAIESTLEQLLVNPLLLKELLGAEYIDGLKENLEDMETWRMVLSELLESQAVFDPENPHLAYFSLSLIAFSVLKSPRVAQSLLKRALDIWEGSQFPLSSQLFNEELGRFGVDLSGYYENVIEKLSEEQHYNWITI
jgi:tetratricopeptide (TPR) repeat protein